MAVPLVVEDAHLVVGVRVTQRRAHEEAVGLRLGKRIRTFLLDWVLRGHHQERSGTRPALQS